MLISVNTFWTILLIVHGLLAVALLGALTHQAMAVLDAGAPDRGRIRDALSRRARGRLRHRGLRAVDPDLPDGSWIYTKYRIYVRIPIEQAGYWKTQGFFELKEHAATLGLGLLPIYWYIWKNVHDPEYDGVRKSITALLAFICWFNFLVGHVLNNVRGFGS